MLQGAVKRDNHALADVYRDKQRRLSLMYPLAVSA